MNLRQARKGETQVPWVGTTAVGPLDGSDYPVPSQVWIHSTKDSASPEPSWLM